MLVLAANPCPCGRGYGADEGCECTPTAKRRYRERVSGPVRDRIDIYRKVEPVRRHEILDDLGRVESTSVVAGRVAAARARQRDRYAGTPWRGNREIPGPELRRSSPVDRGGRQWLEGPLHAGHISARGVDRVLRLAWTLADLFGHDTPLQHHVETAYALRVSDPLPEQWPTALRDPLEVA